MGDEMTDKETKETKEIHKTEFVDKQLPKIYYEKSKWKSISEGESEVISVSDKSSVEALATFKKMKEVIADEKDAD
jgi:hypothetical protein